MRLYNVLIHLPKIPHIPYVPPELVSAFIFIVIIREAACRIAASIGAATAEIYRKTENLHITIETCRITASIGAKTAEIYRKTENLYYYRDM